MKKLFLSMTMALFVLACGSKGGSDIKYVDNKVLREFPSVFVEFFKYKKLHKDDMSEEIMSSKLNTEAKINKIQQKYMDREKEVEQKKVDDAASAFTKIKGRDVPFKMDYDDSNFKILSAKIEDADPETGALTVTLMVEAKRDFTPSEMDRTLNYVILNSAGKPIFKFTINPFFNIPPLSSRQFATLSNVVAGKLCCAQGSKLMLYCGSYDFTDFAEILFMNK